MKAISKIVLAGLLGFVGVDSASACNHRCPSNYVGVVPQWNPAPQFNQSPQLNPATQPIPIPPTPAPNGLTQNDTIINDLPVEAKRAIKAAAAKARANSPVRQSNVSNQRLSR